jgi:hypothetical protein
MTRCLGVGDRGRRVVLSRPSHPDDAQDAHEAGDLVPADVDPGAVHGRPELVGAIEAPVEPVEVEDAVGRMGVGPLGVCHRAGMTVVVGARGDRHVAF